MSSGIRKQIQKKTTSLSKGVIKIDSPIAKYDSAGNLTCIMCKIPIKPNVWKVHINSKQHKQSVELAKQRSSGQTQEKLPPKKENIIKDVSADAPTIVKNDIPQELPLLSSSIPAKVANVAETVSSTTETLPDKFFDPVKSSKSESTDRTQDEEWNRFQKEIRDAATESNIIIAEEQDDVNNQRHLKEIDEQIDKWNRFIQINEKKNSILHSQRRTVKKDEQVSESSSSEEEENAVEDLYDWRIKSLNK
ncbi:zinc finger protein 830 [Drosophila tropicalis]|uniref:zinc finger protein 830 n=1 Tax=Drosophila tropicalis TaxID=46794 RepID=UPI0035ABA47D